MFKEANVAKEPLNEKEAIEDALMVQKEMGLNKEGKMMRLNDETGYFEEAYPTAEDYENASQAIDEIRQLAEQEGDFKKIMYTIGRISVRGGYLFRMINNVFLSDVEALTRSGSRASDEDLENMDESYAKYMKKLNDAQKIFNDRKKEVGKREFPQ